MLIVSSILQQTLILRTYLFFVFFITSCYQHNEIINSSSDENLKQISGESNLAALAAESVLVTLKQSNPDPIIRDQPSDMTFNIRRADETSTTLWMITNYSVAGGITHFQTLKEKEALSKGEISFKAKLHRPATLIMFTVRNLSLCYELGFTDEQCLGKYSMNSLNKNLDHKTVAMIESHIPNQATDTPCNQDKYCLDMIKKLISEVCDNIIKNKVDFSIPESERLAKAGSVLLSYTQSSNKDLIGAILATAATIEIASTKKTSTEKNREKQAKELLQKKHKECIKAIKDSIT